jgi:AcrR family transcriptional regulator
MAESSGSSTAHVVEPWGGQLSARRLRTAERIALVAAHIIDRDGIASLSMSRLADEAGVSRQTLYQYFPDVDAVLEGIATVGAAGVDELARAVADAPDAYHALHAFVTAVLEAAAAGHPSPMTLVAAVPASSRAVIRGHEEAVEGIVIGLIRRGQARGVIRSDVDPELDGRLIYRATLAAHDLAAVPNADVKALARHLADGLFRMLAA